MQHFLGFPPSSSFFMVVFTIQFRSLLTSVTLYYIAFHFYILSSRKMRFYTVLFHFNCTLQLYIIYIYILYFIHFISVIPCPALSDNCCHELFVHHLYVTVMFLGLLLILYIFYYVFLYAIFYRYINFNFIHFPCCPVVLS